MLSIFLKELSEKVYEGKVSLELRSSGKDKSWGTFSCKFAEGIEFQVTLHEDDIPSSTDARNVLSGAISTCWNFALTTCIKYERGDHLK